jgi:YVTN family beta-propeller protein
VKARRVVETIDLPADNAKPVGVAVSPDGGTVFVATGRTHSVVVIDARTRKPVATIPVGRRPWGLVVSPDGRFVYTANGLSNDVSVIDTRTRRVVATIAVGTGPWGLAFGR